ncbi:ferredoxin family protein [Acetobacteraceae bacterium H6797]|nr:ferredoxin family protein [Acetobacteraceae bacterium H6797]
MIELLLTDRCTSCGTCASVCPANVFDEPPDVPPVIARQADCQTCFLCELHCEADALYVGPDWEKPAPVSPETVRGLLGEFRRHAGWHEWEGAFPNEHWRMDEVFRRARE